MKRPSTVWFAALLGGLCVFASNITAQAQPQPQPKSPQPSPGPAAPAAPSAEDRARAESARKEGLQLAAQGDYKGAADKLKDAYRLSKDPAILYEIGSAYDKLGESRLALFYYKKYLDDADPKGARRAEVSERVSALEQVKETKPDEEVAASSFTHKVVEEAPPGWPIDITVQVPEGSGWQARLLYRADHENEFALTLMQPRKEGLVGRIPAAKTTGAAVQYYVEIYDRTGVLVDSSGRPNSPNLVSLDASAQPVYYADIDDPNWKGPLTSTGNLDDRPRTALEIAKWTSTAVFAGSVAVWITASVSAGNYSSHLEDDARDSATTDDCIFVGPCRAFSFHQRGIEADGKRYEQMANIALGVGLVSAGVAGYFWYRDLTGKKSGERAAQGDAKQGARVTAVPVVGEGFVGGAALLDF